MNQSRKLSIQMLNRSKLKIRGQVHIPFVQYLINAPRRFHRNCSFFTFILVCLFLFYSRQHYFYRQRADKLVLIVNGNGSSNCDFVQSTDEFILAYRPFVTLGLEPDLKRAEPTVERIRTLLNIVQANEAKYQPLLQTFDVFEMGTPKTTILPYANRTNVDEIQMLYNRFIHMGPDGKSVKVDETLIEYLRKISSYLADGFENKRTTSLQVDCYQKPVFVMACDSGFFNKMQASIRTLNTYWPDHKIVVYDMGHTSEQQILLRTKCTQCTVIKFPFAQVAKVAPHINTLSNYAFKPFVVQDALRRYGSIIYGDASARYNNNSFDRVLIDNYLRGFAARELPGHFLPCFTRSDTFTWFNQSHLAYDDIYMAEANFLAVTDTFLSRLIMKAWLTCALDPACLMPNNMLTQCSRSADTSLHRFDQSAMVIILTHFFFQGRRVPSLANEKNANNPAPYDMYASVQTHLGDINRVDSDPFYLFNKSP